MTIVAPATTVAATGSDREPQIAIKLGGDKLPGDVAACVLEVHVDQTADHADHLTLQLTTWNPDPGKASWIDDNRFAAGAALELAIGYGETLGKVFDGDIVGLGLELHATEAPVMTVDAYNRLHRLGRGRRPPAKKTKSNSTYGDLVTAIATRYDLTAKVEGSDADKQNKSVVQQNESDLEFIAKLAEEIGYVFYVDGQDLVFKKDVPGSQPPTKVAHSELLELSGHIDFASQVGAIDGFAFDHDGNKRIPYQKTNDDSLDKSFGKEELSIARPLLVDRKEQLEARVDAEMLRIRNRYFAVTATCFGRTDIKVGMTVELQVDKLAKRFEHLYTVTAVSHSFSQGAGFRTRLTLKGTRS